MTLKDEDRKALIENYKDKSWATIDKVKFLIEHDEWSLAVNRIYYGMYYMLSALALKDKFKTSQHAQLIGWFNKTYVKPNVIDKKYSKILQRAFENRMEGDYNVLVEFFKEEVERAFEEMKEFIEEIETLL